MLYLKQFESENKTSEYLKLVDDLTNFEIAREEISDIFSDIKDHFEDLYYFNTVKINLKEKKESKRKKTLICSHIENNPKIKDIDKIQKFLLDLESAKFIEIEYILTIFDKKILKSDYMKNSIYRLRSMGYKVESKNTFSGLPFNYGEFVSVQISILGDLETKKIDSDTILSKLPENIIKDFEEFTNSYGMSKVEKIKLINIIRKGNWS
jgi:hypothetical protein